MLPAILRAIRPERDLTTRADQLSAAQEQLASLIASIVAWFVGSLSSVFQDILLSIPPIRHLVLRCLGRRFSAALVPAVRPPPPAPTPFEELDYYVDPRAAETLQLAALHALSVQLEHAQGEPLPPTQLLPSVSHVLLQTEERKGGKNYLEAVATGLAGQMRGAFVPVDAMLLATLLAEALGGGPEAHMDLLCGGAGYGSTAGGRWRSRVESRMRFAWQALQQALEGLEQPSVVFFRSSDALICPCWEAFAAFLEVFGPKSGEALVMEFEPAGKRAPRAPVVYIAGVILPEAGAALVGGKKKNFGRNGGDGDASAGLGRGESVRNLMRDEVEASLAVPDDSGLAGLLMGLSRLVEEPCPDPRKLLPRAFPTRVRLAPPPSGPAASRHRARLQKDAEGESAAENYSRAAGVAAATGVRVPPRGSAVYGGGGGVSGGAAVLRREDWEKVLAWAVSMETMQRRKKEIEKERSERAAGQEDGTAESRSDGERGDSGLRQRRQSSTTLPLQLTSPSAGGGMRRSCSATESAAGYWTEDLTAASLRAPLLPASASSSPLKTPLKGEAEQSAGGISTAGSAAKRKLEQSMAAAGLQGPSNSSGGDGGGSKLQLSEAAVQFGLEMWRRSGSAPHQAVQPENSYEKQLLVEVLSPEDLGRGFSDVGALDDAKRALREAVQLPLQRPELFEAGALARPSSGVLLFGPPGTGKTLLARAAAAESGASFLELSMSALSSKWFGDSTKLVRAAFSLAAKLAPCVLFVDEVDALLGRRAGGGREHEATRELKNEFMSRWDGIRGDAAARRVIVLGATNRPFDLDEAVLRRFSSRVAVGLPVKKARCAILDVILAGQALAGDVKLDAVADKTEGFSGADLRQLCVSAAMRPVRELVEENGTGDGEKERKKRKEVNAQRSLTPRTPEATAAPTPELAEAAAGAAELNAALGALASPQMASALAKVQSVREGGGGSGSSRFGSDRTAPRAVNAADFDAAVKEVGPTVDPDSLVIQELKEWDSKYGTHGVRGEGVGLGRRLAYYT